MAKPSSTELLDLLSAAPGVRALDAALRAGRRCVATGVLGSATSLLAGALARSLGRPVLLVLAHLDDAEEIADELTPSGLPVLHLPALEASPGESGGSDLPAERLRVAIATRELSGGTVIACSIHALMQAVPDPAGAGALARTLRRGQVVSPGEIASWLVAAGYRRVDAVEEVGDFAVRGGITDIFPPGEGEIPVRLDFFGDTLDRLSEFDPGSQASDRTIEQVNLIAADETKLAPSAGGVNFLELVPRDAVVLLSETGEVVEQGRGYYERVTRGDGIFGPPAVLKLLETRFHAMAEVNQFSPGVSNADARIELHASPLPSFARDAVEAVAELGRLVHEDPAARAIICCQNDGEMRRAAELLDAWAGEDSARRMVAARIATMERYLHRGFGWSPEDSGPLFFVPYAELMSRFTVRRRGGKLRAARAMDTFLDFEVGDHVVHADHGIARFAGLTLMAPRDLPVQLQGLRTQQAGEVEEYLTLEFAGKARLHVPATQVDKVQKYVGGFAGKPPLSTLGGQKWKNQTERVAESVKDLAAELMRVRAAREHLPGISYPADTTWQREFEDQFPYEETEDQLAALAEIKRDMTRARPMDRLICGDVGFGKTEVAIRAAFKAAEFGKQVAVLVPTTVLCEQHERTFRGRFAGYPFRVESISRFKTDAQVRETLEALRKGHVDIIIGTHRLLSQDVHFPDLGLVIVDEEQRFGVEHKEALLRLRLTVDVLTLSATPIPRTLHMAMLGIRDISSLTTPPADRRAIVTEVIPWNATRLRQAIQRELAREGQVYYVHNRVHDIRSRADDIQRLVPDARIVVGHGQMPPHELEDVMLKFLRRQADILVATTIIESGIDIASANTMVIDDADRFGLADLHQLRGRVGRSKHRAYCYLLLPPDRTVKEVAQKRLKAIEQYSMLGAGFKIAMRDLEIRGAGNILGAEQSGHIAAVGYEMYCRLLEGAVRDLSNSPAPASVSTVSIELGAGGHIPRSYIPSDTRRLEGYRRLAVAATLDDVAKVAKDLADAYGAPPSPVVRLLELAELRVACLSLGIRTITIRDRDVVLVCDDGAGVARTMTARTRSAAGATVRALPPKPGEKMEEVYFRPPEQYMETGTLLAVLRRRLGATSDDPTPPPSVGKPTLKFPGAAKPGQASLARRAGLRGGNPGGPSRR